MLAGLVAPGFVEPREFGIAPDQVLVGGLRQTGDGDSGADVAAGRT